MDRENKPDTFSSALAGGDSFGGTIRNGVGCLILLIVLLFVFAVLVGDPGTT